MVASEPLLLELAEVVAEVVPAEPLLPGERLRLSPLLTDNRTGRLQWRHRSGPRQWLCLGHRRLVRSRIGRKQRARRIRRGSWHWR